MNHELLDALEEIEGVTESLADSREMLEYVMEYFEDENPTDNHAQDVYKRAKCFGDILLGRLVEESARLKAAFCAAHKAAGKEVK